jgi:hypothetical protein
MAKFTIRAYLWCKDEKAGKRGSDKIWGYGEVEGRLYSFWGRRAESDEKKFLRFQIHEGRYADDELSDKALDKIRKRGYARVSCDHQDDQYPEIEKIYPNFTKSFQKQLVFAKLADTVMPSHG